MHDTIAVMIACALTLFAGLSTGIGSAIAVYGLLSGMDIMALSLLLLH